ncbi:MAG: zinc ribbon domain-containing protein [Candidatus Alcyoniella australis]|nr:zinc ribbon domain-containing protein [Candidatus Alcyoniella australis]
MPIYEYICLECGVQFERLQNADEPAPVCPFCEGEAAKQLSAPGGFAINGQGHSSDNSACCGRGEPCDQPKRCCEK